MSKIFKNLMNNGYTTHYSDGSKSTTFKNVTDSGYTTHHDDGSKSVTYRNVTDSGFTTYDIPNHQTGGFDDGGLFDGPCLVFGATVIFLSFVALLKLGKSAILALLLIAVSILVRVLLNRKYGTGFFTLWAHPLTLLGWRLLANALLKNTNGNFLEYFGVFFLTIGIIISCFWDCSSFGMFFYEFTTIIFMVVMKAYGEYAPYWMLAVMGVIATIATIVIVTKRSIASQPINPIQNPQSHASTPKAQSVHQTQAQSTPKPQARPASKSQTPVSTIKPPLGTTTPSVQRQQITEKSKEDQEFEEKLQQIVAEMLRERE